MNNEKAVHPSDDLTDDDYRNIKDRETQHKRINQHNSVYTLVENQLQSNPMVEDPNETND